MFDRLYPIACQAGVDPVRYWDMTYREIVAAIDAFSARQKAEQERSKADMQIQAVIAYRQANLIGALVSKILGGKNKIPTAEEAFPGMIPQPKVPQQQDWRRMKERIQAYADWHRKRGERRGHDDRGAPSQNQSRDESAPE